MEEFARDMMAFVESWSSWHVTKMTEGKNLRAVLVRDDDFPMTLIIQASLREYPQSALTFTHDELGRSFAAPPGLNVSDAIDAALAHWEAEEYKTDVCALDRNLSSYEDALEEMSGPSGAASYADEEDDVGGSLANQLYVQRVLRIWEQLAQKTDDCYVFLNKAHRCISVHVSLSVRNLEPMRCVALSFKDAEYLLVVIDVPLSFPVAAPKVRRVALCNFPDVMSDTEDTRDENVGVLSWYIKNRFDQAFQATCVLLRGAEDVGDDDPMHRVVEALDDSSQGMTSRWLPRHVIIGDLSTFDRALSHLLSLDPSANMLVRCQRKLQQLMDRSTCDCFVCGMRLPADGMRMMPCATELCCFSVERLGLGVDVLSELQKRSEVFELLMMVAYASAIEGDKRDFFNPMCNVDISHRDDLQGYRGPKNFYVGGSEKKGKNLKLVAEIIDLVPPVSQMLAIASTDKRTLRRVLDKSNPLVYPFLQWLISSNRSHIQAVPPLYQVKGLGPHQFLLLNHNPSKEAKFRLWRKKCGSFFAWHGSGTLNWHSILREGLKSYSGTKFMTSGQVYGAGIYVARSISTSIPYMSASKGNWRGSARFAQLSGCSVIALCEVANDTSIFKDHNNDIITVSDDDAIVTRFLFVFPGGIAPSIAALPSNEDIAAQLTAAFPFVFTAL